MQFVSCFIIEIANCFPGLITTILLREIHGNNFLEKRRFGKYSQRTKFLKIFYVTKKAYFQNKVFESNSYKC